MQLLSFKSEFPESTAKGRTGVAVPFTIARTWKQPKCPSTEEWVKKILYIYTKDYHSAMKRNEIGSFVKTWMDPETVLQSEVSQKESAATLNKKTS